MSLWSRWKDIMTDCNPIHGLCRFLWFLMIGFKDRVDSVLLRRSLDCYSSKIQVADGVAISPDWTDEHGRYLSRISHRLVASVAYTNSVVRMPPSRVTSASTVDTNTMIMIMHDHDHNHQLSQCFEFPLYQIFTNKMPLCCCSCSRAEQTYYGKHMSPILPVFCTLAWNRN